MVVRIAGKSSGISLHYEKHKGNDTAVNGLQRHNERKPGQKHSNENIKDDRTAENVFLRQSPKKYKAEIEEKITNNKKGGMKNVRKNSVRMVEATVQLSGTILEQTEEKQEEVLRDMYEWLKDEHGEDNIISAVIHKDETNMHLHFDFVPITEDGRLSARDIISETNLKKLQRESLEYVQDKHKDMCFERGKSETKGLSQKDFEAFKALQAEEREKLDVYSDALDEQDVEQEEREKALDHREGSLMNREEALNADIEALNESVRMAQKMDETLTGREEILNTREREYKDNMGKLGDKEERLTDWESLLRTQETAINERERVLADKDQEADEKLSEAENKLNKATEKDESATERYEYAEKLLEEVTRQREEMEKVKEENSVLMRNLKQFSDRFMNTIEAARNGDIGMRTLRRVANRLNEPYDDKESLNANNLVLDELEEKHGGIQL